MIQAGQVIKVGRWKEGARIPLSGILAAAMAIQSFADKIAEEFFYSNQLSRKAKWSGVRNIVRRKLDLLHYAADLIDLSSPPGNRLQRLAGDLQGLCSIRVNDQFRIVFRWTEAGPADVRVVDYH